jgi:hypothetical protein
MTQFKTLTVIRAFHFFLVERAVESGVDDVSLMVFDCLADKPWLPLLEEAHTSSKYSTQAAAHKPSQASHETRARLPGFNQINLASFPLSARTHCSTHTHTHQPTPVCAGGLTINTTNGSNS